MSFVALEGITFFLYALNLSQGQFARHNLSRFIISNLTMPTFKISKNIMFDQKWKNSEDPVWPQITSKWPMASPRTGPWH